MTRAALQRVARAEALAQEVVARRQGGRRTAPGEWYATYQRAPVRETAT
jgi:hypothetical protein